MQSASKCVNMVKQALKWRESASLIILSKDNKPASEKADYKALLFSRSEKASFMPTSSVFPGGVRESADESPLWLKYFQSFGLQESQLRKLILERNPKIQPQPHIFTIENNEVLHRDISLRITAIRETFEEVGIMLCRDRKSLLGSSDGFGFFKEDFDRVHWQHLVHNDPTQFLNLCRELDVVPDLWSLNEWSVWLTPATFRKRFETAFYLVTLHNTPQILLESNEGIDCKWLPPKDCLLANSRTDIWLPPPQLYELSRLLNFEKLQGLKDFAYERAKKGTMLMLPVQYKCTDGMISLLPGDSKYPEDPQASKEFIPVDMTMAEFRNGAEKLHRFEYLSMADGTLRLNFEPIDGHLKPVNNIPSAKL